MDEAFLCLLKSCVIVQCLKLTLDLSSVSTLALSPMRPLRYHVANRMLFFNKVLSKITRRELKLLS